MSRPADSVTEMNELVLPSHTNALGTIFGGVLMSWIDVCAAMSAMKHARSIVVTASMDGIDFIQPIQLGEIVNLKAMVNYVGRSSMEVGVRVESENPVTGERKHTASAYLTFVSLTAEHRPAEVPRLELETPEERLRHDEGKMRRAQRIAAAAERRALNERKAR